MTSRYLFFVAERRLRHAVYLALAVIVPFTLILGLVEAVFRIFDIRPERYPPQHVFVREADGRLKDYGNRWGAETTPNGPVYHIKRPSRFSSEGLRMGEHIPGVHFVMVYGDKDGRFDPARGIAVDINSLGLRGPEISAEKPAGTFRILGLGDSFAFGWGIADEDTFLRKLEHQLSGKTKVEVLNAGVPGYNTRDEVLYYERVWSALSPDLVLICFYLNDAYDDATFHNLGQELGTDLEQPDGLAKSSYLYDFIQHGFRVRKVRDEIAEYYKRHYFTEPGKDLGTPGSKFDWSKSRDALESAAKFAAEHNSKVALVIYPDLRSLDDSYPFKEIHRLVREASESFGIPALDLFDAFKNQKPEELWVHISDQHPNGKANTIAAAAIAEFLRARNLLPDTR